MTGKETAFVAIKILVDRFADQYESYIRADYNETLTRRDFIDPFFKALGWDIDNSLGYAEAYREVVHEDKIKIAGITKAPDYSFKLAGGKRLFFLEAKKPSISLKDDGQPAYQLRSYAYSSGMPISIISDFEEFVVYDCTKKPKVTDRASTGRVRYLRYTDYLTDFDFIWETFSKERVLKGGFDKFILSDTAKKGTATVDRDFVESLDEWRTMLATAISKLNHELDDVELNFVVQQFLDRIIFLRIAEDRGVEPYASLKDAIKHGDFYSNVFSIFRLADEKYNSGIFDFKKDRLSAKLRIDNKTVKNIIENLYFPNSPFRFAVMPVEILGSAYEQFLGKQITLDKNHKAKIEEKPEVRKAGGVYYTPQYVVDYIVNNTIGNIARGKSISDISKLRIVDPSCGSGSFLLGAYKYLLDYHKDYYSNNGKDLKGKDKLLTPDGNLTTAEKKRILVNNIFGVDIDSNAVEVTKLSLLLKCMEGETEASISTQMKLFNDRVLPTLDNNIKNGNSLIGTDFYKPEFDFEADKKTKPFDWPLNYPEIFKKGGFDILIGNPPWGAEFNDSELAYLKQKHKAIIVRMIDSYMYFIDLSLALVKPGGSVGLIVPSTVLNQIDISLLREKLLLNSSINILVNLGEKVFGPKVTNTSTIIVTNNSKPKKEALIKVGDIRDIALEKKEIALHNVGTIRRDEWSEVALSNEQRIFPTLDFAEARLLDDLRAKFVPFKKIVDGEIQRGISPDLLKAFIVDDYMIKSEHLEMEKIKPVLLGKHIERYKIPTSSDYIIYLRRDDNINNFPNIKSHLSQFRKNISCKEVLQGKHPWFSLHRPRDPEIFQGKKFVGLTTSKKICVTIDENNYYSTDALFLFKLSPEMALSHEFVLGVIQSKVFQFLFNVATQGGQRVIPQIKAACLYDLPFPNATKQTRLKEKCQQDIHKNVVDLFKLANTLNATTTPDRIAQVTQKIQYHEDIIDHAVYQLYDLSPEQANIIQKSLEKKEIELEG